jgi:hypothetical protein
MEVVMSNKVTGLLLNAGVGGSIDTITVDGLESIQSYVGGTIDAVRTEVADSICAVGYVHDEGLILDLEMNWLASALFSREIRGNVVLVNGYNKDNEYDGDNHEFPEVFVRYMKTSFLKKVADCYNESQMLSAMLQYSLDTGLISKEGIDNLMEELGEAIMADDEVGISDLSARLEEIMTKLDMTISEETTSKLVDEIYEFLDKEGK